MTLFQALIMRAAEICTLCPMKTIRLINGWTYFPLPSIPAISFLGPFSARWTDSFSLSWQAFTSFYKIRPAANSDWLDRSVQFKCPQRKRGCTVIRRRKKKKGKKKNLCLQNVLLKETAPCHLFPDIITYAITENVRRTMCHPISACWRPVRNRSIYREAVSFTMVNMYVVGQWRLDGFAAVWHLIYGCMQGEGWSRPPLSLNQIIAAAREKKQMMEAS